MCCRINNLNGVCFSIVHIDQWGLLITCFCPIFNGTRCFFLLFTFELSVLFTTACTYDKQKKYDDLAKKKGAEFDKAYISFMVDDHKEDISEFEEAAKEAKDPDVKAWAEGKLPTLKHHLEMAEALNKKTK